MTNPSEDGGGERVVTVQELLHRITPRAWATPTLMALIVVGFGVEIALGVSPTQPTSAQLLRAGGTYGPFFAEGQWWRAVTALFLHAGPLHLAFNLWAFWSAGQLTERLFGNRVFILLYFLSGIGGSLTSLSWNPMVISVGASGAIFGVYGSLFAFMLLHRGVLPVEYLNRQRNGILVFVGYNVIFGLLQKGTDMAAHGGGFVVGALAASVLSRDLRRPFAHATRRALIAAGFVLLLVVAGVLVRARLLTVPIIRADRDADAALTHLKAKEYRQAIERYSAALSVQSEYDWFFNRAIAYAQVENLNSALTDFRAALAIHPTKEAHAGVCDVGIRVARDERAFDEVISHCTAALESEESAPVRSQIYAMRAAAREERKQLQEALDDANASLALDPQNAVARTIRASVNLSLERLGEAEDDCKQLLSVPVPRPVDTELCKTVAEKRNEQPPDR